MAQVVDQRIQYRRYEDRRVAVLLAIHEILFETPPGEKREEMILAAIQANYGVDRAAFVSISEPSSTKTENKIGQLHAKVGDWSVDGNLPMSFEGVGFEQLLSLHCDVEGALSFECVRRPDQFSIDIWESLWSKGSGGSARALLSMEIRPKNAPNRLIWLQHTKSTREWSSRDRDLIEEIAGLLARAIDKDA